MKISIAERYRPFSHLPGIECLLPRTTWALKAFPTKLILHDCEGSESIDIALHLHGWVKEFTVQQDLEKGCLFVWGHAKEGLFCFQIQATQDAIELLVKRAPKMGIGCNDQILHAKEHILWPFSGLYRESISRERLFLGCHKSQDWSSVWPRMDLREILPILYHLSQWIPAISNCPDTGIIRLLDQGFEDFLRAGFSGLLIPHLVDDQYLGLLESEIIPASASPCALIEKAGTKIRKWFVDQNEMSITLLNHSGFECGRMIDIQLPNIGSMNLEWSKGLIQKVILRVVSDVSIRFVLPKPLISFRLRTSLNEKGRRIECDKEIFFKKGINFLDKFQK